MKSSRTVALAAVAIVLVAVALVLSQFAPGFVRSVRGKGPAVPLSDGLTPEQQIAQDLALSDTRVQSFTVGRRSEVFGVSLVGDHYTAAAAACAEADCRQVNIYNFDDNAAVTALVDVDGRVVLDVLYQPGVHPGINQRLVDLAMDLAINDPDVIEVLGYKPAREDIDMAPVDADAPGTSCDGLHLCVAPTFNIGNQILWVMVDLTEEKVAGVRWTSVLPDDPEAQPFAPAGCPAPGIVVRDGWSLNHEVTGSDGLRLYNISYNGVEVATSIKLAEWHADYGTSGYRDSTGCSGGGGGFPIYPYGDTVVTDLHDGQLNVIGFQVTQDFRMGNWGQNCNYRYDQRIQFFNDGRFRTVSGAYGKGCGTNAIYRPLVRVDIAVEGDDGDTFSYWNGTQWLEPGTELWLSPPPYGTHYTTDEGFSWRVSDSNGAGFYLEPGQGQFEDNGRGDDPFVYAVQHHPNEGDTDLGVLGDCCLDDHQQGPHNYVNGEAVTDQNIVLWYVPVSVTDAVEGDDGYYCWTLQGEPNPVTFPCYAGPMFVPLRAAFEHATPVSAGQTVMFTNTSVGAGPLTYAWDFGDGSGASAEEHPEHVYAAPGTYTITLAISDAYGQAMATSVIEVLPASTPFAAFSSNSPVVLGTTAVFTNTSGGEPPLAYTWDFGDGVGMSTEENPTYDYQAAGTYTVTLTVINAQGSATAAEPFTVLAEPPAVTYRIFVPMLRRE